METKRPTHPELVAALAKPGFAILDSLICAGNPDFKMVTVHMEKDTKEGARRCHLWHMGSALLGEAAELLEGIGTYFEQDLHLRDTTNIMEELGDIEFYAEGIRAPLDLGINFPTVTNAQHARNSGRAENDAVGIVIAAANVFDVIKKHVIYNKALDVSKLQATLDVLHMGLASFRHYFGWSREQTLEENITKLLKRYGETYTDKAAQERADKAEAPHFDPGQVFIKVDPTLTQGTGIMRGSGGTSVLLKCKPADTSPQLHQEALTGRPPVMSAYVPMESVPMESERGKEAVLTVTAHLSNGQSLQVPASTFTGRDVNADVSVAVGLQPYQHDMVKFLKDFNNPAPLWLTAATTCLAPVRGMAADHLISDEAGFFDAANALTAEARGEYSSTECFQEYVVGVTRVDTRSEDFTVTASTPAIAERVALEKAKNRDWGRGDARYVALWTALKK